MERSINDKEKEQITNLGAFEYDSLRCASVLEWDEKEVIALMSDDNSEFMKLYNRGKFRAEYVIDLKLFEQSQAGDIKSLEKFSHRKRMRD